MELQMTAIVEAIRALSANEEISGDLAADVARDILSGESTPAQIGGFLVGLNIRGETIDQISSFARVMREYAMPVEIRDRSRLVDTCGTGGDGAGTFNISTAAALVAAGAGARIAKHGNRAVTGDPGSGSADVLAALGVKIDCSPETSVRCLETAGIAFFFAPAYHGAMRHAGPVRREIGVRSIFNLLGPMANPAQAGRQVIGVGKKELTATFAEVLRALGSIHVMVVHGSDGLDELTLTGPSHVTELREGDIKTSEIHPADLGLTPCRLEDISGADQPEGRARQILEILDGHSGARREITLLNAAAALVVGGPARDLHEGIGQAAAAIDDGRAEVVLNRLVEVSNSGEST
jgi:anthranilate phosphoribosyltransferase